MCHYLGGGLHGRKKRVKAQSESSKSVVNSVLISREMPVFPGFLEIIRVVEIIIPLEYILELYSKYELLFVRMSFKEEKDKKIQRRHRWLVIKVCKLSVHKVLLFQKKYWYKMYSKMSVEGFEKLIEEFRNECDNER